MLERKDHCAVDIVLPFVAPFINRNKNHKRTASMPKADTHYSIIICNLDGWEGQRAWTEEALVMHDETVRAFNRMLLDTFDKHCS